MALIVGNVCRGVDAGKNAEVVDEMSLIEVTGIKGDVGPMNSLAGRDLTQDLLKAADAAEEFWSQADFVAENLDEVSSADSDLIRDGGDSLRFGRRLEFVEREGD